MKYGVHVYVKTLGKIAGRYAPSRLLSFDLVHVFIVLQLIEKKGHVSRNLLCKELSLGEGSVKTLVKHLKTQGIIESTMVIYPYLWTFSSNSLSSSFSITSLNMLAAKKYRVIPSANSSHRVGTNE